MRKSSAKAILPTVFAEYQPIIDLAHNRMVGCEALARWTPKGKPPISIGNVIDSIEANEKHAMDVTRRMLACIRNDLEPLLATHPHFCVHVNIPPNRHWQQWSRDVAGGSRSRRLSRPVGRRDHRTSGA